MNITEFNLSNVRCAGCVGKIQNKLNVMPEIKNATVNLLDKTLHVEYTNSKQDKLVIATIRQIGYAASLDKLNQESSNPYIYIGLPLVVGILLMIFGMTDNLQWHINNYTQAGLSLIVLIITARQIFISGIKGIINLSLNMHTLIALSVVSAWIYSTLVTLNILNVTNLNHHVYFDSALMIIGLINLGHYFEQLATKNTKDSIKSLLKLQPAEAILIENGIERIVSTSLLKAKNIVKVLPGNKIAADGIVTEGHSYVNESMISGEAIPILKQAGDKVIAGSLNTNGSFNFQ